jgi:exocyst complex component 2
MTVVQELDKTLFEGYMKPKASLAVGILRGGILDSNMDWYETPQPTGNVPRMICTSTFYPAFQKFAHTCTKP